MPFLGVFVYLIARGHKMQEHAAQAAQAQDAYTRQYVQSVATSSATSTGRRVGPLAELRDKGVITEADFQQAKAKALA